MGNKKLLWGAVGLVFLFLLYIIDTDPGYKAVAFILLTPIILVKLGLIPWGADNARKASIGTFGLIFPLAFFAYFSFSEPKWNYLGPWFIAGMAALLALSFYFRKQWMGWVDAKDEKERQEKLGEFGTAVFEYDDNTNSTDGLYIRYYKLRSEHTHILTIAPPGEGKGATLIIPNLLKSPFGSYVVTDPKGEIACITARAQKEYGQKVYILDPWNLQKETGATHGIEAAHFNPFDMIRKKTDEWPELCGMIANILCPDIPDAKDPFWRQGARTIIRLMLLHILTSKETEEQNFWTLFKLMRLDASRMTELLREMRKNEGYDGLISALAEEFIGLIETTDTYNGVMGNARTATSIFESPGIRRSMSKSDFDPYELANGNVTLYIDIPDKYMKSHSEYLKIVLALCFKAVNEKPKERVNFIIDEAGYIGKIDDINESGFTFGRGQKISVWCFYQTVGMVQQIYGEAGMNDLLGKCRVVHYFGLTDPLSTQHISKRLGNSTRVRYVEARHEGEKGHYEAWDYALMTPDEIAKDRGMITFEDGKAYDTVRMPYYSYGFSKEFQDKADPTPEQNRAKAAKMAEEEAPASSSEPA